MKSNKNIIEEASKLVLKYQYGSDNKINLSVLMYKLLNENKTWIVTTV